MYEDETHNYDPEFTKNISYMIHVHSCPFHIIYSHVQSADSIAI